MRTLQQSSLQTGEQEQARARFEVLNKLHEQLKKQQQQKLKEKQQAELPPALVQWRRPLKKMNKEPPTWFPFEKSPLKYAG